MTEKMKAELFPWLIGRENPDVKPLYKIVARAMTLTNDSVVMLHRSGENFVENYYIQDIVEHENIMNSMDVKEANLLRWVVRSEILNPLVDELI